MPAVHKYKILFRFGKRDGTYRIAAEIQLSDDYGRTLALLRFCDRGQSFPDIDNVYYGETIILHFPFSMFELVVNFLRNEEPVYVYSDPRTGEFEGTSYPLIGVFLGTSPEPFKGGAL